MFRDENHPQLDFASLPSMQIKRHFTRKFPVTFEDLKDLVRVVKPLSERFPARLTNRGQHEGQEQTLQSHPSLFVTLAVAEDEVCRVDIKEDWKQAIDLWHSEILDISETSVFGNHVAEDPYANLRNDIVGRKSRRSRCVSVGVVGLEEWTSVETSSDMSPCSEDEVASVYIMKDMQNSGGSVLALEDMAKRERERQESSNINSFKNGTLERDMVGQLHLEAEYGASMTTTSMRKQHLKDFSTNQQNIRWQLPAITEITVENIDNINCYSNSDSNGKAPNLDHFIQSSSASVVNCRRTESVEQIVADTDKRNSAKNDLAKDGLQSQKHTMTSEYQYAELAERDNRSDSLNRLVELKQRLKAKRGKDERPVHRNDQKEQIDVDDEDILNEGRMELERALKRRAENYTEENKHRKLENVHLFHGRTLLDGKCVPPWPIPMEVVSNERHYKWKDRQLVSYMNDPRLEKHIGQRKDNPAECDLIQPSFAIVKSEPGVNANESVKATQKTASISSVQNSAKTRCHATNSIATKSRDATDKSILNVPHSAGSVQDLVETVEGAYTIPVVLSQSYFSYVQDQSPAGPDDWELDQNMLPPDWMDEHSPETRQDRSSCCYVNETLRNVSKCILDARMISDDVYRDAMLMESLQCIKLALNIHPNM